MPRRHATHVIAVRAAGSSGAWAFYCGPHARHVVNQRRRFVDSLNDPDVMLYDEPSPDADVLCAEGYEVRQVPIKVENDPTLGPRLVEA